MNKDRFEAAFSEAYRQHLQQKADAGKLGDITEIMWMVWQTAEASVIPQKV